jgi:hypothetical protein
MTPNRAQYTIAETPFEEPRLSQEYVNAKYKDWLRRRGLTDPAYARELEQMEANTKRLRRAIKPPAKKSRKK